jgi:hypothetical protein
LCVLDGLFHTLSACETCLLSVGDLLCSIGNFFFAGARIFFQSLDAAIFLYSRVSHIPIDSLVLPAICTNDRLTLGCELKNGMVIRGQNEISHPMPKDAALGQTQAVNKVGVCYTVECTGGF